MIKNTNFRKSQPDNDDDANKQTAAQDDANDRRSSWLCKEKGANKNGESRAGDPAAVDGGGGSGDGRQAATDQFMLERFRKRERHRVTRR